MNVLVTDGSTRAALAVTRSLGAAGHRVLVGDHRSPCLAQTSRYCSGRVTYPDPSVDEAGFIEALLAITSRERVDVVVPITDITTALTTCSRHRFEPRVRIPFGDAESIRLAADKRHVVEAAVRLGVPVPKTVIVERFGDPFDMLGLTWPTVVKPHRSRVRTEKGWQSCSVSYAADPGGLEADLQRRAPHEYPLLLQECVRGPGIGVFACYHGGRPTAFFSHRRLREKPPSGGVSVLCESLPLSHDARTWSERLLGDLRWEGVAMVEYKVDARDGAPKLMEINGRFWGSLQLAIDAGVDFPRILLKPYAGAASDLVDTYRIGVKSRWLLGDFDSLLLQLFGDARATRTLTRREKLRALREFVRFRDPQMLYENPRLSDLGPWIHESWHWLRRH